MKIKKYITILSSPEEGVEPKAYSSFKVMCEKNGFPYNTIKMNKFPFEYNSFKISKTELIRGTRKIK